MFRYLLPLIGFSVLLVFLVLGLKLDPRRVPSPLIDKPIPEFSLPQLYSPEKNFSPDQLRGHVWLLNVWASWCAACRIEHPVFNEWVKEYDIKIIGLNYKDEVVAAKQWLEHLGNPYLTNIVDFDGRVGIDWGVYGVPETFVIDKKGVIRYKHIGPVAADDIEREFIPLIDALEGESG